MGNGSVAVRLSATAEDLPELPLQPAGNVS